MRQIIKIIDIKVFFGKGDSMSNKMFRTIKKDLNKKKYQPITIDEFCNYYGISREEILPIIQQNECIRIQQHQKSTNLKSKEQNEEVKEPNSKPKYQPYRFS
jgi:hypothetical protein